MRTLIRATFNLLLLFLPLTSFALPQLTISPFFAQPGQTGEFRIEMSGGDATASYSGFNAELKLPQGISITSVTAGALVKSGFSILSKTTYDAAGAATLRILAYSAKQTWNAPAGILSRITFTADPTVTLGNYKVKFTPPTSGIINASHALSNGSGSISLAHQAIGTDLKVIAATGPDFDGDGLIDLVDSDDDNDGIPDDIELLYGLNPFDASDALTDLDADGINNLAEYQNGTQLNSDSVPPTLTPPTAVVVNSTGSLTPVTLGQATASDAIDGVLTATSDSPHFFAPGSHTVVWSATDTSGNTTTATQSVSVIPLVNFEQDQIAVEGSTPTEVIVRAHLNGDAATYPVTVPFSVTGTADPNSDHNAVAGEIVIGLSNVGETTFSLLPDAIPDSNETILFTMGSPTNAVAGSTKIHTVTALEGNQAPQVALQIKQGGVLSRIISTTAGTVTITATVNDPNTQDTHNFDWSGSDNTLTAVRTGTSDAPQFTFDPTSLTAGIYQLAVTVNDSATPQESRKRTLTMRIIDALPILTSQNDSDQDGFNDLSEGMSDPSMSGLPAYLNPLANQQMLQLKANEERWLAIASAGTTLQLGHSAFGAGNLYPVVNFSDIEQFALPGQTARNSQDDRVYNGGIFDLHLSGLNQQGSSAALVLSQFEAIPSTGTVRTYLSTGWLDFVTDANNSVSSAAGEAGICPAPGSDAYQQGITSGHFCLELLVEDGGPNDADGVVNGAFRLLAGIGSDAGATTSAVTSPTGTTGTTTSVAKKSSSGMLSPIFLLLMLVLLLRREYIRKQ